MTLMSEGEALDIAIKSVIKDIETLTIAAKFTDMLGNEDAYFAAKDVIRLRRRQEAVKRLKAMKTHAGEIAEAIGAE